jgi:hypothetical protein
LGIGFGLGFGLAQTKVDDLAKQSKGVKQNGTGKLQTPVELTLTRTLTQTLTLTLRNGTGKLQTRVERTRGPHRGSGRRGLEWVRVRVRVGIDRTE